jgi:hypothetical protein
MAMKRIALTFPLLILAISYSGFSQLRSPSEYNRDGINLENTYYVLYESDGASYGWASQWTQSTARTYEDKIAIFKWYFKDGSLAYARQGNRVGDIGMITKYLLTDEAGKLKDIEGNDLQPMTLENYPVRVELWIGSQDGQAGFKPEILVDAVCNDQESIQYGYAYYFAGCSQ